MENIELHIKELLTQSALYGKITNDGLELPEGYIFKDENGNVINATKIVLEEKKKGYPKTYEECCKVIDYVLKGETIVGYRTPLLRRFQKLLICRDAYWKIAREETRLGQYWKPDWSNGEKKYTIKYYNGEVIKDFSLLENRILVFPTKEMRDAFYENFKEDVEICKELL